MTHSTLWFHSSALALVLLWPALSAGMGGVEAGEPGAIEPLIDALLEIDDAAFQADILRGIREGLEARTRVPVPRGWSRAYARLEKSPSAEVRRLARILALRFGDEGALASLRRTMLDPAAPRPERREALDALVESRVPGLAADLQGLIADAELRRPALRGLAAYDHPDTPHAILTQYRELEPQARDDAIGTLASRPEYALALLDAVERDVIDRRELSTFTARRLDGLGDERVRTRLREVWGEVRRTPEDKRALIAKYRALLAPAYLDEADLPNGRAVFQRTCMPCHALYGEGGAIGPDLTGSNRGDLDYLLDSVVDPNAAVGKGYLLTTAVTRSGRVVSGIVRSEDEASVRILTLNEELVLAKGDLAGIETSASSMMPEGLLEPLADDEVRDVVAYLRSREQVPLPPPAAPAASSASAAATASGRGVRWLRVPDGGIQPQVVEEAPGAIHLAFFKGDPTGGDIFYARSDDGGETFSARIRVNTRDGSAVAAGGVRGAHIAAGAGGRVHAVWMGSARAEPRAPDGSAPLFYTRFQSETGAFEVERNLIRARPGLDGGASVAADRAGSVVVAWHAPGDGSREEERRRVWLAVSRDGGETFSDEIAACREETGACACCGLRASIDRAGRVLVLYRAATGGVHRDMYLLGGSLGEEPLAALRVSPWEAAQCMMSTSHLAPAASGALAAWETRGEVYWARVLLPSARGELTISDAVPALGAGTARKHPVVAEDARGETILVWTEGIGSGRGGTVAWQLYDAGGRAIPGASGSAPGVPAWSFAAAFARAGGGFAIIY